MRRLFLGMLALVLLLSGCAREQAGQSEYPPYMENIYSGENKSVVPVGTVPEEFRDIVEENRFWRVSAFTDKLLKYESDEEGYVITLCDLYGEPLTSSTFSADTDLEKVVELIATSDGGFLLVLGTYRYAYSDGVTDARIIKCDTNGQTEWETIAEGYDAGMLRQCIERADAYYFFGEYTLPMGEHYLNDNLYVMKMRKDGKILMSNTIGGSDFEFLHWAEKKGDTFVLYCYSCSEDGIFGKSGDWEVAVDSELCVLDNQMIDLPELVMVAYIGTLDDRYITHMDEMFDDFRDGIPRTVIDYGDFYLIVSENVTGIYPYEKIPYAISSAWCYTETVYGAYDKDGNILWKATVDSSPDYDAMAEDILKNMGQ